MHFWMLEERSRIYPCCFWKLSPSPLHVGLGSEQTFWGPDHQFRVTLWWKGLGQAMAKGKHKQMQTINKQSGCFFFVSVLPVYMALLNFNPPVFMLVFNLCIKKTVWNAAKFKNKNLQILQTFFFFFNIWRRWKTAVSIKGKCEYLETASTNQQQIKGWQRTEIKW